MSNFTSKLAPGETNFVASKPLTQAEADTLYFPIDGDVSQGNFGVNMNQVNDAIMQAIADNQLLSEIEGDQRYLGIDADLTFLREENQAQFNQWLAEQEVQISSLGTGLIESAIAEVNAHRTENPAHTWEQISGKPDFVALYRQNSVLIDWSEIANIPPLATDWNSISGKPLTFPPSAHTHDWGQITGSPPTSGGETTYNVIRSSPAFTEEYEDFLSLSAPSKLGWSAANTNGTIGAENANRFPGAFGVMALGINSANAGTSDYSHLRLGSFPVIPKQSEGYSNIEISAVVGLASQTQTELSWSSRFGLLDTGNGLGTNFSILISAEYFSSGYNWVAIWKDGNGGAAQRQIIGSVSGDLSIKLFDLKIKIDCLNFKINFYVDTLETEVVIGSSNWNFGAMSPIFYINRTATNSLARTFWVDKFLFRKNVSDAVLPEAGEVDWIDVLNKPLSFPPEAHTHPWSQVTDKPDFNSLYRQNGIDIGWNELTGIPATFAPSTHTQDWNTIINPPATATRWPSWSEVTSKPSTFVPTTHASSHATGGSDPITPASIGARAAGTIPWTDITGEPIFTTRWPTWDEVTNKPATFTPSAHRLTHRYDQPDSITPIVFNNNGINHGGPFTDFNAVSDFGFWFVHGTANGPNTHGAIGQYYSLGIGLGNNYSFAQYNLQLAIPRNVANPYPTIRYRENGVWSNWNKISAGIADSVPWSGITGLPATFTPSAHIHDWANITGEPVFTTRWPTWAEVTGKPTTFDPPDSGNAAPVMNSGWVNDASVPLYCRKIGNVVFIRGSATRNAGATATFVATLPSGYRPTLPATFHGIALVTPAGGGGTGIVHTAVSINSMGQLTCTLIGNSNGDTITRAYFDGFTFFVD